MRKGLSGLLAISLSCLTLIIIIVLSVNHLTSEGGLTASGNTKQTASTTTDAKISESPASDESEIIPEAGSMNEEPEADQLNPDSLNDDLTNADLATASPDPAAVSDQALTVEESADEEPALAEVTPEPDMDPDSWDYIRGGDYNMIYTDEKTPKKMPYEIRVNKLMNCVTVYKADKKGKYTKPVKAIVCSAGSATPLGTFKTSDKYYWKAMIHGVWAQYATRITGKFLFHSVPYDDHEKNTLIPSYYNRLGSTASAGCVRMSVKDAKWIIENCPAGTTVKVYNDYEPGPLGKPEPIRIPYNCRWDPTDPDVRNPWNSKKSTITGVKDRTVERCSGINLLNGILAYDIHTKKMSSDKIKIKGGVNAAVSGKYEVKYSFKDSKKKKINKSCTFTVVDTKAPVISGLPSSMTVTDASTITSDYIYGSVTLTDNGMPLTKEDHLTITASGSKYTVTAHDDYGHHTSFTLKIIEDSKAPVIKLKKNIKSEYPVTQKIDKAWAAKRITKVSDNKTKLSKSDVKISFKPNGWGMSITYSAKDDAGNKTTVTENIAYETAQIALTSDSIIVKDIKNEKSLAKYVKVTSTKTGKKVPYKLSITREKAGSDDQYKIYNVTYTATVKSSAGSSKTSVPAVVYVKK